MKKILLTTLFSVTLLSWAGSSFAQVATHDSIKIPPGIRRMIDSLKSKHAEMPPASIYRYDYKGQQVYYKPAECCDQYSYLMNGEGKIICHPDGGFTGSDDRKCPDFFNSATNKVLVWQDTRNTIIIPPGIQKVIDDLKSKGVENPPASIYRYDYNGQQVYYRYAPCCDQMNALMNDKGEIICYPDGGLSGLGDGKCPDFKNYKKNGVLVWKDSRAR